MRYLLRKYDALPKPAKASLWFTACFVVQRGLQFVGMPIFTRIMSQEDYGVYSVFLSWTNLLCVFSTLSIYNGVFNKAAVKYEEERDQYISSVQYLTLLVGILMSAAILLFHEPIETWTGFSFKLLLLMCLHILTFPSFQYWAQKQRFVFEYTKLVVLTLLNSFLSLALGILFVLISDDKGLALISVSVFVQTAINTVIFVSIARKGRCAYKRDFWVWSTISALPLIPHYLSEILLGHADRIMINQMCGPAEAGIYNIVYQLSMIMTIIRTGVNGAFTPWLYISLKGERYLNIRRVTSLLIVMMTLLTLLLILIGPEILRLAAPPSYYEAVIDMPAIMLGCYFIFVYVLFLNIEIYYEQNQFVAVASGVAAVASIVANIYCIPLWGYLSCGYTTMASYILMALMHYCFFARIRKKNSELSQVFNMSLLFNVSLLLTVFGVALLLIYDYTALRWSAIFLILAVIYVKKPTVLATLKELRVK